MNALVAWGSPNVAPHFWRSQPIQDLGSFKTNRSFSGVQASADSGFCIVAAHAIYERQRVMPSNSIRAMHMT